MGVFGHDYVCPNMIVTLFASAAYAIDQPLSASILAQERLAAKAGKGEGVSLTGSVVPLARFPPYHGARLASRENAHANTLPGTGEPTVPAAVFGPAHAHGVPWAWHPAQDGAILDHHASGFR